MKEKEKKEDLVEELKSEEIIKDDVNKEILLEETEEVEKDVEETEKIVEKDFETKYLELLAETENNRKRYENERKEMIKFRASSFIQSMLPGIDMFEMSLGSKDVSDEVKQWLIGFEMILSGFKKSLESEGVTEINVKVGDKFDGKYHFAIDEMETDEFKPGEIVKITLKGYELHGRLLRPTTVVVAKAKEEIAKEGEKNE